MTIGLLAMSSSLTIADETGSQGNTQGLLSTAAMINFQPQPRVVQSWEFRVLLGDREIGIHEFQVTREGEREQVEINAQFDVRFLFFNAYSYAHQNKERWDGNCLDAIESITDDNGTPYQLRGMARDGRFIFEENPQGDMTGPACTRSFAYWNPRFLDSDQLLNAQTGEIVDVAITPEGYEILTIDNQPVSATRYSLAMDQGVISLWYGRETGQWLALEAPAKGGRVLRYEPVRLPNPTVSDDRLALE